MNTQTTADQSAKDTFTFSILAQNFVALAFGALILYAVGFIPMEVAHNAAHDTRHALVFPCH